MTLNTYATLLPFLQVPPRQKISRSDVVFSFGPNPVHLLSGRLWHGYDEYACFEADVKVWLNPPKTGSVYLGGVYQHRHRLAMPFGMFSPTPIRDDYYELHQLHDLSPITALPGSTISIDRDFFNIEPVSSAQYNAWDVELVLVVDE